MSSTTTQALSGEPQKVPLAQQHVSHEAQFGFQNVLHATTNDVPKHNTLKLPGSPQMHHASPPKRRYPTLITFMNGQPIPHPLRLPTPQSPIRKLGQKALLPPLRAQPAIVTDVTAGDICRDGASRKFARGKQCETLKGVFVTAKRFSRWLVDEDRVLVNAYRKHGNDWRTIAKLLPGRTPLAVRKRFHGKIRDQFGFAPDGKSICTCT